MQRDRTMKPQLPIVNYNLFFFFIAAEASKVRAKRSMEFRALDLDRVETGRD
jgi:hypothetical protein